MSKVNSNIQAILDIDLEKLLAQTNQLNDFIEGKIKCPICGTKITEDNIGILYASEINDTIQFEIHCNNIDCLSK